MTGATAAPAGLVHSSAVPKARQVLAALRRDGWVEVRRKGSHRRLKKGDKAATWSYHEGEGLGNPALAGVAKKFGYSLEDLRELL